MGEQLQSDLDRGAIVVPISPTDIVPEQAEVELTLGYADGTIPPHFAEMIAGVLAEVPRLCSVRAGYRLVGVERVAGRADGLLFGGKFLTMREIITGQLKRADQGAVFVCTIGPAMESRVQQLFRSGDFALGYVVDAAASVVVERVCDILHDKIGQEMLVRGPKITNRFSPGYCDWSVDEQHLLFSLLPPGFCEVTLTSSALMTPIKSVSGIVGVGTEVTRKDYVCERCGMKDCTYPASRAVRAARAADVAKHRPQITG